MVKLFPAWWQHQNDLSKKSLAPVDLVPRLEQNCGSIEERCFRCQERQQEK